MGFCEDCEKKFEGPEVECPLCMEDLCLECAERHMDEHDPSTKEATLRWERMKKDYQTVQTR